jgi:hypothetical protein
MHTGTEFTRFVPPAQAAVEKLQHTRMLPSFHKYLRLLLNAQYTSVANSARLSNISPRPQQYAAGIKKLTRRHALHAQTARQIPQSSS